MNITQTTSMASAASQLPADSKASTQTEVDTLAVIGNTTFKVVKSSPIPNLMHEVVKDATSNGALVNGIVNEIVDNKSKLISRDPRIEENYGEPIRNQFNSRARCFNPERRVENLQSGQVLGRVCPSRMKHYSGILHCYINDNTDLQKLTHQLQQTLHNISQEGEEIGTLVFTESNRKILGNAFKKSVQTLINAVIDTDESLRAKNIIFLIDSDSSLTNLKHIFFNKTCSMKRASHHLTRSQQQKQNTQNSVPPSMVNEASSIESEAPKTDIKAATAKTVSLNNTDPIINQPSSKKKKKAIKNKTSDVHGLTVQTQPEKSEAEYSAAEAQRKIDEHRQLPAKMMFLIKKGQTNKVLANLKAEDINCNTGKPCYLSVLMSFITSKHGLTDSICKEFVEKGANINQPRRCILSDVEVNITPLLYAIYAVSLLNSCDSQYHVLVKTISVLLKAKVEVNTLSECLPTKSMKSTEVLKYTPLALAAFTRQYDLITMLLKHGADPNIPTSVGCYILPMACLTLDYQTMRLLFEHHPKPEELNVNAKTTYSKDIYSNIHLLVKGLTLILGEELSKKNEYIDCFVNGMNLLKQHAVDLSAKTAQGQTAEELAHDIYRDKDQNYLTGEQIQKIKNALRKDATP